jgi:hypothetical protein
MFTRAEILAAIDGYTRNNGKPPTRIHVPVELELAAGHFQRARVPSGLRDQPTFMGLKPVWDAKEFRLE